MASAVGVAVGVGSRRSRWRWRRRRSWRRSWCRRGGVSFERADVGVVAPVSCGHQRIVEGTGETGAALVGGERAAQAHRSAFVDRRAVRQQRDGRRQSAVILRTCRIEFWIQWRRGVTYLISGRSKTRALERIANQVETT